MCSSSPKFTGCCFVCIYLRLLYLPCISYTPSAPQAHGTSRINAVFRALYGGDLWLRRELGLRIARDLLQFIRSYCYEAWLHRSAKENMFSMFPKLHLLHEVWGEMVYQGSISEWILNPISETCSMDEDFVGRCAILTRSVSPRLNSLRSLQRYLTQIHLLWQH